jgi:flagellar secretion chaperone FliS
MSREQTDRYHVMKIETASPPQLLLLTYSGALQSMRKAARLIAKGNHGAAQAELLQSMAIVVELESTLKAEAAPELAEQLRQLYQYVLRRLGEVTLELDPKGLEESIGIISSLHDTWQEALSRSGVLVGAESR